MVHQSACHVPGKIGATQTIKRTFLLHEKEENVLFVPNIHYYYYYYLLLSVFFLQETMSEKIFLEVFLCLSATSYYYYIVTIIHLLEKHACSNIKTQ